MVWVPIFLNNPLPDLLLPLHCVPQLGRIRHQAPFDKTPKHIGASIYQLVVRFDVYAESVLGCVQEPAEFAEEHSLGLVMRERHGLYRNCSLDLVFDAYRHADEVPVSAVVVMQGVF